MRRMNLMMVLVAGMAIVIATSGSERLLGAVGLDYPGGTFSDDNGSAHQANIEAIAAAGITVGCGAGDDLYCPKDEITRAQFATFLDRALDLPVTSNDFFDDDNGNIHEAAINNVAAADITSGCAADRYCPQDPLTRGQMATLLAHSFTDLVPATDDYFDDDDGTTHEDNINIVAENGITMGCASDLYCPKDPVLRDQMASFLVRALDLEPIEPIPIPLRLEQVFSGISGGTTDLQAPPGDDRLFLVTRDGSILIIEAGAQLSDPFLDLSANVLVSAEEGMLGLAFHPGFAVNRKFYVFYSDSIGDSQVVEYQADANDPNQADLSTARPIITFEQRVTSPTHKAGQLQFGADGYLYIAVGDGGGLGDPFEHGQDPTTELGTIIRIDVDSGDPYAIPPGNPFADGKDGLAEVWAYGLRNPWRFSFDGSQIYIADVGRAAWEEINVNDAAAAGVNYGWDTMEGSHCHEPATGCDATGLFVPQVEYGHDEGVSVIGGYVYRGLAIPALDGTYFYSDFTGGWLRSFRYDGAVTEHYDWSRAFESPSRVWSFGVDGHGELYVLDGTSIWKLVPNT